ncbi:hypothetical protein HBA55_34735 [Pseudomaricurvus alkylphenolicus]|uniref:hypothetical protein n=1 Tax=Pseudomaricurvus alkylphenolicus TaxID=1306991 RepID=UPI0014230BAF|nr:hypothetical protein [Pseudomaricurvus alkylphenolicus]NIB44789.1 hypothetical protein [Pseudomaricurvus alkylphenolicus]
MDKRTREKLEKTMEICQCLLNGEEFSVSNSEIDLVPKFLNAKSPTAAKQQGLVLKRAAKPIGKLSWHLSGGGNAYGQLYLGKSFKRKEK